MITGGLNNGQWLSSAEIYNPNTNTGCLLPQLPEGRIGHSVDNGLDCLMSSCFKWSPVSGTWTQSHTLRQNRRQHLSWATASGVYLIGGSYSMRTSEKVKLDGSVEEGFGLKYDTRFYNLHLCNYEQSGYLLVTGMHVLSLTLTIMRLS